MNSGFKISNHSEATRSHPVSTSQQAVSTSTVEEDSRITNSSSDSESNGSSESEDDSFKCSKDAEPLSEKEINEISAKILRAELLGDQVGIYLFMRLCSTKTRRILAGLVKF